METVFLRGIEVEALIGVHAYEREGVQPLRIDLDIGVDLGRAGASDALADTVDYAEVAAQVRELAAARRDLLLEALAASLCDALMARWPMRFLRLTIHKPAAAAALGCADVGVTVERGRAA